MEEELERSLAATTSADEEARKSATSFLASLESHPDFASCLLSICATGQQKNASATYLKNFVKSKWTALDGRNKLRTQVLEALLNSVDSIVINQLTETFRIIAGHDFSGKENTWLELVSSLSAALQNSDMLEGSQFKTFNVLLAVKAITKPFRYFLDPTVAREPIPLLLENISNDLIVPLHGLFRQILQNNVEQDKALVVLLKIFHFAVGSHMPSSLGSCLSVWIDDIVALLEMVVVDKPLADQLPRLKSWKQALHACSTLSSRHPKRIENSLPTIYTVAVRIVSSTIKTDVHPMQERIQSLAFDLLANILETGQGWRLMAPQFSSLLQNAIFPALMLRKKDIVEWNEDADEYVRKNLPSDLDDVCGWRSDLLAPRRSSLNLLAIIATSKGPPNLNERISTKRKKCGKKVQETAGQLVVVPHLSQYALPPDGAAFESIISYYAVLLAYGCLQEFFKAQSPQYLELILSTRVFPLYSFANPSPYLLANANWLLGELAACLPEAMNKLAYDSLLKAFLAENVGGVSWGPVRASAAGALVSSWSSLRPKKWLSLLQACVFRLKTAKEEAALALKLLKTAAEVGDDEVAPQVPYLISSIKDEIEKYIGTIPEPWPEIVEYGFSAVAALAQSWDSAEPDKRKNNGDVYRSWKEGCPTLLSTLSDLLVHSDEMSKLSCLIDTSVILAVLLKYTSDANDISRLRLDQILEVWAELISEGVSWDQEEDLPIFDAMDEIIALNARSPLENFMDSDGPCSLLEGMAAFTSLAMELAYPAATWRACRLSHSLLHSTALSFDGERVAKALAYRFTEAAFKRLQGLPVPLGKPLVLVIATCYIGWPDIVEEVLSKMDKDKGILKWGKALSELAGSNSLHLESELKLAVLCLSRIIENACRGNLACHKQFPQECLLSLLEAGVSLKEAEEQNNEDVKDEDVGDKLKEDSEDDESDESEEEEETEDEFLERYAEAARELHDEVAEDTEGEEYHEIELGVLALTDEDKSIVTCVQNHVYLLTEGSVPLDLLVRLGGREISTTE